MLNNVKLRVVMMLLGVLRCGEAEEEAVPGLTSTSSLPPALPSTNKTPTDQHLLLSAMPPSARQRETEQTRADRRVSVLRAQ